MFWFLWYAEDYDQIVKFVVSIFMEDIPLCSKLYVNIVKQVLSKHNFITMFKTIL